MSDKIRKIDHKGETYISLSDLKSLLNNNIGIDDIMDSLLEVNEDELSDWDKKMLQTLNWNPNEVNPEKIIRILKVDSSKENNVSHTRNFIEGYKVPLEYSENKIGKHQVFEIQFSNQAEYVEFFNDLRQSMGFDPF